MRSAPARNGLRKCIGEALSMAHTASKGAFPASQAHIVLGPHHPWIALNPSKPLLAWFRSVQCLSVAREADNACLFSGHVLFKASLKTNALHP